MSENNDIEDQDQGAVDREGDDDDFGGFEAAEPIVRVDAEAIIGEGAAAPGDVRHEVASSWPVIVSASAASMIRPDLLCPRNTFPPCLDPAGIANVPSRHCDSAGCDFDAGQLPDSQGNFADGASQHCSASGLEVGDEVKQHIVPTTVQSLTVTAHPFFQPSSYADAAAPMADVVVGRVYNPGSSHGGDAAGFLANGMLPDLGLGVNDGVLHGASDYPHSCGDCCSPRTAFTGVADVFACGHGNQSHVGSEPKEPGDDGGREANEQNLSVDAGGDGGHESLSNGEVDRIRRDMIHLESNSLLQRQELERLQNDLRMQRSRLTEVQQQHVEQLEEVRQAGHNALAIVVEEYKELARSSVLEQQEVSQRHLLDVMEQQMALFHRTLDSRQRDWESEREAWGRGLEEVKRQTLVELKAEMDSAQPRLQEQLAEMEARHRQAVRSAGEVEQARCQSLVSDAVLAVKSEAMVQLESLKAEQSAQLEEQRRHYCDMMTAQCREERALAQEHLSSCLQAERCRGRELAERVLSESQQRTEAYLREQSANETAARRRQLASLDLFLECARTQLDMLLTKPPTSSSPQPSDSADRAGGDTPSTK